MAGFDSRGISGTWGSHWALPSDLSGPEAQLHLEGQVDHGAQGSRGHQQCQEHPVSMSRREAHQETEQGGTDPPARAKSQGHTHSRSFGSRNSISSGVTLKKKMVSL